MNQMPNATPEPVTEKWAQEGATRLLKGRSTQYTWMHTFDFQMYLEEYLRQSGVGAHMRGETAQATLSRGLIGQWEDGDRYVLSTAAAAALLAAVKSMEGEVLPPILPLDVPGPSGLVFLPQTVYGMMEATRVGVSCFSWSPCYVGPRDPGILVSSWTSKDAEEDDVLNEIKNAWKLARKMTAESSDELVELRRTLVGDAGITEEQRTELLALLDVRSKQAKQATASTRVQPSLPEYSILELQPFPFGREFTPSAEVLTRTASGSSLFRSGQTLADAGSLAPRLPYAFWLLLSQGVLAVQEVGLPTSVARKFSKKRLPCNVLAVTMGDAKLERALAVTAHRQRSTRAGAETFTWSFQASTATE